MTPDEARDWLAVRPEVRALRVVCCDLNGQARGKRLPVGLAAKALEGETRIPLSVLNVDIWGDDIEDSPLVFESGDRDGLMRPTGRGLVPMPWLAAPGAMLPTWVMREDGSPFPGDPRHALGEVVRRWEARGLFPQVATELEFYLVDDAGDDVRPPPSPRSGKRRLGGEILSMRALDAFDAFFNDLYAACEAMGLPAQAAISEAGMGQYEIDLAHRPALRAADDAWLFKLLVRGLARKHGFAASFMAKPYADHSGNGMHVHFSAPDAEGNNAFDDGGPEGSAMLRHAVAGCLAAMPSQALVFAPHGSSYDRFVDGAHAPTGISWAYENRTAAIRIPSSPPAARRIEHRVAGGDVNPYLLIASILGAALVGIEDGAEPPPPVTGNAYAQDLPRIAADWGGAIARFGEDPLTERIFPAELTRNFLATKRQELAYWVGMDAAERMDLHLDTV